MRIGAPGSRCARSRLPTGWWDRQMTGMLDNKVVLISGVGPALGTTLARRCAEAGADLVLAARTVERLEDVAKQVTDMGRRAVSVGTDITDQEQVNILISESLKAYGR